MRLTQGDIVEIHQIADAINDRASELSRAREFVAATEMLRLSRQLSHYAGSPGRSVKPFVLEASVLVIPEKIESKIPRIMLFRIAILRIRNKIKAWFVSGPDSKAQGGSNQRRG